MIQKMIRYILLLFPLITLSVGCDDKVRIRAVTPRLLHAEVPHYDSQKQVLIFGDQAADGKKVCTYNPRSENTTCTYVDEIVGPVVPLEGSHNRYLAGIGPYLVILEWDGVSPQSEYEILQRVAADKPENVFNDGKVGPDGRFWLGTVGERDDDGEPYPYEGNLYHYAEESCELETDLYQISVSNGIAWSSDGTKMFYIDSYNYRVDCFDYDRTTGGISYPRPVFDFKANMIEGLPDGMTIDSEDKLWIACQKGYHVIQADPSTGKLLRKIKLPVYAVTSVTWGGPELDILYVTTSQTELSEEERAEQPWAGSVLEITGLGAKGRPANNAVICHQK